MYKIITAVELRNRMEEIIDEVINNGTEFELQYRKNKRIRLVPVDGKISPKTKAQKVFEYLDSPEYQQQLKQRIPNPLYDEQNPRQEKMNFREEKAKSKLK